VNFLAPLLLAASVAYSPAGTQTFSKRSFI